MSTGRDGCAAGSAAHLPFSAVVGQEDAKLALLLAAMEPRLGGVLLRGDKGSAKTTLARGLAALLPEGAPFVELPLGAGEDRVVGAIDVAALLGERTHTFRPGLLAAAHGGVLYVDEVNLLPDHLVDTLLDVAVSGVNRVERDGFSETHPARFVLVGSMNPEEGELRPQLLDRFGLAVEVRAPGDPDTRAEIVRRQLAFEAGAGAGGGAARPAGLAVGTWATGLGEGTGEDVRLRARLEQATPASCAGETVVAAAHLAVAVGAEGLRADLSLCRAAAALAGWEGRDRAVPEDLRPVAPLVLGHRRRRQPFESPGLASDELADALDRALGESDPGSGAGGPTGRGADTAPEVPPAEAPEVPPAETPAGPDPGADTAPGDRAAVQGAPGPVPGSPGDLPDLEVDVPRPLASGRSGGGPHGPARGKAPVAPGRSGRQVGSTALTEPGQSLDPAATAVAHAIRTIGAARPVGEAGMAALSAPTRPGDRLDAVDLRARITSEPQSTLIVFVVDSSGSMAGRHRLEAARAAVLSLLAGAYRRRDRVAMITFRGESAEVALRPTGSVEVARARLAELPTGGRTPLAAGLAEVTKLVRATQRAGGAQPLVVLVTDGRATAGGADPLGAALVAAGELAATGVQCLVVDAETGPARLGLARALATTLLADHVALEELEGEDRDGGSAVPALADAVLARLPPRGGVR